MSKQDRASHPIYSLLPTEIEGFDSLVELALDMRWSWNHATDEVWRQLDPDLWAMTNNPWVVLQTASRDEIKRVLGDPVFRKSVDGLVEASRQAAKAPAWFQRNHAEAPLTCAAYFSMEFMLSEALPIYSGGLEMCIRDRAPSVTGAVSLRSQVWKTRRKCHERESFEGVGNPWSIPMAGLYPARSDRQRKTSTFDRGGWITGDDLEPVHF